MTIEAKQELMQVFESRKRYVDKYGWVPEGKVPYGFGPRDQHLWDWYHNHMKEEPDGTFSFSIQTYDGPDGDRWWDGRCRFINNNTDVEIVNDGSYWKEALGGLPDDRMTLGIALVWPSAES